MLRASDKGKVTQKQLVTNYIQRSKDLNDFAFPSRNHSGQRKVSSTSETTSQEKRVFLRLQTKHSPVQMPQHWKLTAESEMPRAWNNQSFLEKKIKLVLSYLISILMIQIQK
jgi:hypothetical protein